MSRNPYLAASRPTSSFTRSSRTSKRNDISSSRGSLLGRSRSSATLGGLSGATSAYSSASSYTPAPSAWQRSQSSSRTNRYANDPSTPAQSSYRSENYIASCRHPIEEASKPSDTGSSSSTPKVSLIKSMSSQSLNCLNDDKTTDDPSVLYRYRYWINNLSIPTYVL